MICRRLGASDGKGRAMLYKVGLVLSLAYYLTAGIFALASSAENGIDLSVCYIAGLTALRGSSPYDHLELTNTRRALHSELATKNSYPFAYPPSVIPACTLLGLLPWKGTQALWKAANTIFLVGSVLLAFRLLSASRLARNDKYLAWSFAFALSPTITVLLVGQSSLLVLFAALLAMVSCASGKPWPAGLSLALVLTKPHLSFPLVLLFLVRRRYKITSIALAAFTVLAIAGLYIGHSSVDTYVRSLGEYASWNRPTNPRLVGIQNLTGGLLGLSASTATLVSLSCGLLFLGVMFLLDGRNSSRGSRRGPASVAPGRDRIGVWRPLVRPGAPHPRLHMGPRKMARGPRIPPDCAPVLRSDHATGRDHGSV